MHRSAPGWRNFQAYTPAAWLVAVTTGLSALLVVGCLVYAARVALMSDIDAFVYLIILANTLLPLGLYALNAFLLSGVLANRRPALIAAACILPIEWMVGFVLGGNVLTSLLFDGRDLISTVPYHEAVQVIALAVFSSLSLTVFGRQIYLRHKH